MEFKWELIVKRCDSQTLRAKVLGGWIVRIDIWDHGSVSVSSVFIADKNHIWKVDI